MGDRLEWLREMREARATRAESVTAPRNVTDQRNGVTCPHCAELEAKVARLMRLLSEAKPPPMSAAERMRRMRERKRAPRAD